jgi:hypothetical protein|tara:strand:+ start:361 stop:624 length:264 start_codon:yes stop_codon:yes gene_type:complete
MTWIGNASSTTTLELTTTNITYTHSQTSSSDTWTITHNLGRFPSVAVVDTGNTIVLGSVTYNSSNQLTVTFFSGGSALATTGKAYLN